MFVVQKFFAIAFYLILATLMGLGGFYPKAATAFLTKVYGVLGISLTFSSQGELVVRIISFFLMLLFIVSILLLLIL